MPIGPTSTPIHPQTTKTRTLSASHHVLCSAEVSGRYILSTLYCLQYCNHNSYHVCIDRSTDQALAPARIEGEEEHRHLCFGEAGDAQEICVSANSVLFCYRTLVYLFYLLKKGFVCVTNALRGLES